MAIEVVPVSWNTHRDALRRVREQVFIVEQQVPRELEWDGEDEAASHFLAKGPGGTPVGCARLLASGQIGRMAVLPEHRGTGLGRRLLDAAVEEAQRQGMPQVFLHAQTQALGFYRKAGFLPEGGEFLEAGIPHQGMVRALPIPFESPGAVARPAIREEAAGSESRPPDRVMRRQGEGDCLDALLECLTMPRRRLVILSQLLDHALFDRDDVTGAVSRFARSSPSADVRILVSDVSAIVSRGHRLVELARRLDSRIEIRRCSDELAPRETSFVTWDDTGFFLMPDFRDYTAVVNLNDPVQARRLAEQFGQLWQQAAPDPELRTLKL